MIKKIRLADAETSVQRRGTISVGPKSINLERRTVDVIWGTETPVLRRSLVGNYLEVLSMKEDSVDLTRLKSSGPVLDSHDNNSVRNIVGTVESVSIKNGQGVATIRFASDPEADVIFQRVREGIIKNISVGYNVLELTDATRKSDEIPVYKVTRFEPLEISLVGVPADKNSQIRSQYSADLEVETHTSENKENIKMKNENSGQNNDSGKLEELLALVKEQNESMTRAPQIRAQVRAAKLSDAYAEELIQRGLTPQEATKEILMKKENQQYDIKNINTQVGGSNDEMRIRGFEDALLNRLDPKHEITDASRPYYGHNLVRQIEMIMPRNQMESDERFVKRAMSTSDLPNILANVAEKSMRQEFQLQEPSFQKWTKQGTLRNYKSANRLMLGEFPVLEKLNEHGEVKMGSVNESKEVIKLDRYAKSIVFTKEMIINDDLSALSDFSSKAARAASRLESKLVYSDTLLANPTMGDGIALFHANHQNLGSAAAISVSSVSDGWNAISTQKTLDGLDYLYVLPKYLIVGPAKEVEARQFVSTAMLAQQVSNINPFSGRLEVIMDPRIDGNKWFLSADPSQIDTLEIARLEAENGPLVTVEKASTPGGLIIFCEHSAGCAALEYRGLYYNPGA